ncbi:tape measure protein [Aliihoeflea sp. PC F10.4]
MADVERLIVALEARTRSFENAMNRANGVARQRTTQIERRFAQMNTSINRSFQNLLRSSVAPLAGIGAALGVRELGRMADTWTDLQSRVRNAVGSVELGDDALARLGTTARQTYSSLEQTVESFIANARPLADLGYSTRQQLDYTESLNNALVISNARGDRARQITEALTKAMAGGKLQGDELNTVIQSGGRVAEALAAGLGTTVSGLRALGSEGKITGRDVVQALTSQMATLRQEAEEMPATITDGFTLLNNALLEYVGNGDQATGVSARISEALVIIADNFDQVADAGLQVAAVLAAGLLGRSIAGMVRTLGLGSRALFEFSRALTVARSMASLSAAFTGLSAAAGPAGVVIGAGLATALVAAHASAQAAEDRTNRLNVEFERLGLRGKQAAEGVDETTEALDSAVDETRVQILRDINTELERMRGSGSWNPFESWFGDIEGQAKELGIIVREAGNQLVFGGGGADGAAYQQIMQLAAAVRDQKIATEEALAAARELGATNLSEPVRRLNDELIASIQYFGELGTAAFANGDTSAVDGLLEQIASVRQEVAYLASEELISDDQRRQLEGIIDQFVETESSADDTSSALAAIGSTNMRIGYLVNQLLPLVSMLGTVRQEALAAAAAIGQATGGGLSRDQIEGYRQYGASRVAGEDVRRSSEAYIREAERRAGLSKTQLDLETEIARVRERSLKDGEQLTDDQIRRVAEINLGGNADRTASGRKGRGGGGGKSTKERADEYQRLAERIAESTANLVAETEVQRGLNPLLDDYGYAVEKARTEQELLNAAKQAGITVTPELREQIAQLAHQYAAATVEAAQLSESQDQIRQRAEEMRDLGRETLGGFIKDLRAGKSGAEALANALSKVADKLFEMSLAAMFEPKGGGGGFFGGIFGSIGKIFGFSKGTPNTGGRRGEARGVVHGQEAVIPLPAGGKVPVQINTPIGSGRGSSETIRVVLQDDSGRMAAIADQRIQTSAGAIVEVSVRKSTQAVKSGLPGLIANAQTREM